MQRHCLRALACNRADIVEIGLYGQRIEAVGQRVIASRHDVLSDKDVQPALHREEFGVLAQDASIAPEQVDLFQQAVRQGDAAAMAPYFSVLPLAHAVMQEQEIAYALIFERENL